jgi:predicted nuclease of predicted toxin-antitoxin system
MILADENINYKIIMEIRKIPIDVFSISEKCPGIADDKVMVLSKNPPKLILTEDKDFGEWVFAHNEKNISVILLRYQHYQLEKITKILIKQLKQNLNDFFGSFTTITTKSLRLRKLL